MSHVCKPINLHQPPHNSRVAHNVSSSELSYKGDLRRLNTSFIVYPQPKKLSRPLRAPLPWPSLFPLQPP
jgi:hypothetical protein